MLSRNRKVHGIILIIGLASLITVGILIRKEIINLSKFTNSQADGLKTGIVCSMIFFFFTMNCMMMAIYEKDNHNKSVDLTCIKLFSALSTFTILTAVMKNGVFKGLSHLTTHQLNGAIFGVFCATAILFLIIDEVISCCLQAKNACYQPIREEPDTSSEKKKLLNVSSESLNSSSKLPNEL